jgi:hypothetical protein
MAKLPIDPELADLREQLGLNQYDKPVRLLALAANKRLNTFRRLLREAGVPTKWVGRTEYADVRLARAVVVVRTHGRFTRQPETETATAA